MFTHMDIHTHATLHLQSYPYLYNYFSVIQYGISAGDQDMTIALSYSLAISLLKQMKLMKPQLRSLQWKQTRCIYRCLFSSIIKVFHCSISHFVTLTCAGSRLCCCCWERLSSLPLHCCCWHHSCSLGLGLRLASLLQHSPYLLDLQCPVMVFTTVNSLCSLLACFWFYFLCFWVTTTLSEVYNTEEKVPAPENLSCNIIPILTP